MNTKEVHEDWREAVKHGEKIDPERCGIGMSGHNGAPSTFVNGQEKYRRIFIRLRTPQQTLTCSPIADGADFARRAAIIEGWFDSIVRKGNYLLTFEARQVTDEEADAIEQMGSI